MPSSSSDMRRGRGRRAAALGARREAAAQYERALRFVPETDIRTRAELLYNQATAYCDVHDTISVRTVEHHVSAILGKLGATARKGAANEALKLGLTHSDRVSVLGAPKSR